VRTVELVDYAGLRRVYGFLGKVMGELAPGKRPRKTAKKGTRRTKPRGTR
jgi:hypothetical protein